MSKSIDVLAMEYVKKEGYTHNMAAPVESAFEAGYKQRNDELIDLLVELEDYFEKRQDADWEGEETGMVPNKEMWFYGQLKDQIEKYEIPFPCFITTLSPLPSLL